MSIKDSKPRAEAFRNCHYIRSAHRKIRRPVDALAAALAVVVLFGCTVTAWAQTCDADRDATPTGWVYFASATTDQIGQQAGQGFRITDIQVVSTSPFLLSAILVKNTGCYATGWWWYFNVKPADAAALLTTNKARLAQLKPVSLAGGDLRFTVVMVSNTGTNARAWWYFYDVKSLDFIRKFSLDNVARIVDLEQYTTPQGVRYAAVLVKDPTPTTSLVLSGTSAAQVLAGVPVGRVVLDWERPDSNTALAVVGSASAGQRWVFTGLTKDEVTHLAGRLFARLTDLERYIISSGFLGLIKSTLFDAFYVDNGLPITPSGPPAAGALGSAFNYIDDKFRTYLKKYSIPAAGVAIVNAKGSLVYARGFGLSDIAANVAATPETLFRIGSESKSVTSIAFFKFMERGYKYKGQTITLSTKPFKDVLGPYFKLSLPSQFDLITVQMVMNHMSGFLESKSGNPMVAISQVAGDLGLSRTPMCIDIMQWKIKFGSVDTKPGTMFQYANQDPCVIAAVMEAVLDSNGEKITYEQFVDKYVLKPLKINRVAGDPQMYPSSDIVTTKAPREAIFYDVFRAPLVSPKLLEQPSQPLVPAPYGVPLKPGIMTGGWSASPVALARLLTAAWRTRMPYILSADAPGKFCTGADKSGGYGLFWVCNSANGDTWHNGGLPGTSAWMVHKSDGAIWLAMVNGAGDPRPGDFAAELNSLMLDAYATTISSVQGAMWDQFPQYGY